MDYSCEIDSNHETFLNKYDTKYMEGHHLIPLTVENATYYFEKYSKNIDCIENIISLCPNCHRAIHLGNEKIKQKLLEHLFSKRVKELNNIGIDISLNELINIFRCVYSIVLN